MFEKEAEEIANESLCSKMMCYNHCNFNSPKHHRCGNWHREYECALKGAEFGFNKANEWHNVGDEDLPKEDNKIVLCICGNGFINGKRNYKLRPLTRGEFPLFQPVYAWKEIVLPELKEIK